MSDELSKEGIEAAAKAMHDQNYPPTPGYNHVWEEQGDGHQSVYREAAAVAITAYLAAANPPKPSP